MTDRSGKFGLTALCVAAFGYSEWVAVTQFLSGHWFLADVGNVGYALYNTIYGRFMWTPQVENCHMAYHFTPFLFLLLPFVPFSLYPVPLVTSYVFAMALCPIPVYLMARRKGLMPGLSLACGVLFLGNHFTGSIQMSNHFEIFFVLFFLCVLSQWEVPAKRFWFFTALALSVKEDAPVWIGAFAFFMRFAAREPWLRVRALRLLGLCAGYFFLAIGVEAAIGRTQQGNALEFFDRLRGYGQDPMFVLRFLQILASFGFLGLAAGKESLLVLIPLPMLLAEFPTVKYLQYYYCYPFIPFTVFTAVLGLARIQSWMRNRGIPQGRAALFSALYVLGLAAVQFPRPTRADNLPRFPFDVPARMTYKRMVLRDVLPRGVPTAIHLPLFTFVPQRPDARMLCEKNVTPEAYVVFDPKAPVGMAQADFARITSRLLDEVDSGTRKLLHSAHDVYIIGPKTVTGGEKTRGAGPAPARGSR